MKILHTLFASRRTNPNHWRYAFAHGGIRTREKGALQAQRSKRSSGIHFGTSSCTAVKDWLKHRLEVTLQAYFTILFTVFHGKKAAKTHGACNFSIDWTNICAVLKYSSRFDNRVSQAKTEYFLRQAKSCKNNKKALEWELFRYFNPQFNCFFSFSMINCLKDSDPITSTIGPKERILITISGSSSWAYLIFTR